jgi:hypothetical protein
MRVGLVLIFLTGLLLWGCQKKRSDCAASLEIRLDNDIGMTQRNLKEAQMRAFLWSHWREKKRATLLLKSISKEGKETDASYEIKVLPAATLVMVVTVNRARYGYLGQMFWNHAANYDVYTVERVQPPNPYQLSENSKVEILPDNATLPYCLRFKGWDNEVESFF